MPLSGALRANAEKLQAVRNFAEAFFLKGFKLAIQQAGIDFGDLLAFLAQEMVMMVVIHIVQAILSGVFAKKALLHEIDFFKLVQGAIDGHQIALSRIFAFLKLGHNFFRGLGLRGRHQTINDLFALARDLDFMLSHLREDRGLGSGFVRSFGVFFHGITIAL